MGSEVIDLKAANGSEIPYLGLAELDLHQLTSTDICSSTETLRVPFLVTGTDQESSVIIGYNVLEKIIIESDGKFKENFDKFCSNFKIFKSGCFC